MLDINTCTLFMILNSCLSFFPIDNDSDPALKVRAVIDAAETGTRLLSNRLTLHLQRTR